ncbi:MAG: hypothetical protein MUF10_15600 [Thermoanaerobaculaceae bacterium]|jgi:hypothetical protein|nr:hypothetical protein [Thermoanaerobaculaceae bacterium]
MCYWRAGLKVVAVVLLGLAGLSCSSAIRVPPQRESERYYLAAGATVWECALQACTQLGWAVVDASRERGVVTARPRVGDNTAQQPEIRIVITNGFEGGTEVKLAGAPGSKLSLDDLRARARDYFGVMESLTGESGLAEWGQPRPRASS